MYACIYVQSSWELTGFAFFYWVNGLHLNVLALQKKFEQTIYGWLGGLLVGTCRANYFNMFCGGLHWSLVYMIMIKGSCSRHFLTGLGFYQSYVWGIFNHHFWKLCLDILIQRKYFSFVYNLSLMRQVAASWLFINTVRSKNINEMRKKYVPEYRIHGICYMKIFIFTFMIFTGLFIHDLLLYS